MYLTWQVFLSFQGLFIGSRKLNLWLAFLKAAQGHSVSVQLLCCSDALAYRGFCRGFLPKLPLWAVRRSVRATTLTNGVSVLGPVCFIPY